MNQIGEYSHNNNGTIRKFIVQKKEFKRKYVQLSIPKIQSAHCQARVK